MKLNTKIRYSLRMIVLLAEAKTVVNTVELGKKMLVSPKYLRKLAGSLEKHHLIESVQGIYGGYRLKKKPEDISLAQVFNANGESFSFSMCLQNKKCPLFDGCHTRSLWQHLDRIFNREFHKITINDIINDSYSL